MKTKFVFAIILALAVTAPAQAEITLFDLLRIRFSAEITARRFRGSAYRLSGNCRHDRYYGIQGKDSSF